MLVKHEKNCTTMIQYTVDSQTTQALDTQSSPYHPLYDFFYWVEPKITILVPSKVSKQALARQSSLLKQKQQKPCGWGHEALLSSVSNEAPELLHTCHLIWALSSAGSSPELQVATPSQA